MFLKNLKLTNFRNFSTLNFKFENPITVLIGDNAQGKTNFLESIYFLATGKSNRADRDDELIRDNETVLRVEGVIQRIGRSSLRDHKVAKQSLTMDPRPASPEPMRGELAMLSGMTNGIATSSTVRLRPNRLNARDDGKEQTKLEIVMLRDGNSLRKKIKVNRIPRRVSDYSSNLAVIFFRPEDINLVRLSPSLRRNHIDQIISQVNRDYKKTLASYEKVIIRKNKLLFAIREGFSKTDELTFWQDQQIMLGSLLTLKRDEYFNFINNEQKKFGNFKYEYLPSEVTLQKLKDYREREILSANSLIGPHRDDFIFKLNGHDLSKFGSRGEQRTAVLDLKFAEVEYVESILGSRPVLLLDDIFSELDPEHRSHVIGLSHLQQTIISSVDWDDYLAKALKGAQILRVENNKFI